MAKENWQKVKLLKLAELLRQETDEQHPLPTNEICARLEQMGYPCERRTLSKDIAVLNDHGIEVLWSWVGKEKGYYIEDRSFSVPELKILIDAVQASSFITDKKTAQLIEKIAALGGTHRAEIMKSNMVCFNTRKHHNESIYYNVDALEDAMQKQKKVIFRYFDLDISCKKAYRRDGHHYVVEPVALVFNEDNYYLVAYSSRYDNTANYRVDRMDAVEIIDEPVSEKALELRGSIAEYTEQAFKMYGGQLESMLSFAYSLLTHECAWALEAVGLDSYAGFLHRDRPGRTSLALDIMEELRPCMADRFVLTLINNRMVSPSDFETRENGTVLMTEDGRRTFLKNWQQKKQEPLTHPFLNEKISWGLVPYLQALLLARYLRGDLDEYPPFLWK